MLPFVPRKVAKALKSKKDATSTSTAGDAHNASKTQHESTSSQLKPSEPGQSLHPQLSSAPKEAGNPGWKGKGKEGGNVVALSEEDYTALLRLSMSEHALWADPDLRRNLEYSDDGFLPLLYVTSRSSHFQIPPSEATLVKAVRAHAADIFDFRLLMSSPSRAAWYGKDDAPEQSVGAYEVRLKDWSETLRRARNYSRNEWEAQTIYVENIPVQHRSVAGIYRFINALSEVDTGSQPLMQSITLPKHHLDKPGDIPKCKGFALIILSQQNTLENLLQRWPWKRQRVMADEGTSAVHDAAKFGLRMISKARWDQLNAEYLQHRQRLLDEIAEAERDQPPIEATSSGITREVEVEDQVEKTPETKAEKPPLDLYAPFPAGCLVHIRHVHTETNKTTLRKLFHQAFTEDDDGIDYVDFNKGMDTCYLRLATPAHATQLVAHFTASPTAQSKGLDDSGSPPAAGTKSITIELVEGTREELYWLKVPEKLRRQAVEKAVQGLHVQLHDVQSATNVSGQKRKAEVSQEDSQGSRRRRKR
ncbi:hypothetical protein BDW22DRAFT_1378284 [Trametopsis cervina]|nr:hypothetical protein BDW22DRAFT_1378284 [Trametopsis cervina]